MSHFQLNVTDVAASARWYRAVLSLVPFAEDLDIGYVALRQPEARLVIVLTARTAESRAPDASSETLDHLAFAVSDGDSLRKWADHLRDLGIAHEGVVLEGGRPSLQLRDPDGVAIELVASA